MTKNTPRTITKPSSTTRTLTELTSINMLMKASCIHRSHRISTGTIRTSGRKILGLSDRISCR
ncbi:hypothetical protein COOONC_24919 [Cooperia oncophora]